MKTDAIITNKNKDTVDRKRMVISKEAGLQISLIEIAPCTMCGEYTKMANIHTYIYIYRDLKKSAIFQLSDGCRKSAGQIPKSRLHRTKQ